MRASANAWAARYSRTSTPRSSSSAHTLAAAHYDDRLMSQRRRESVVHATSAVGNAQVATTNAAETDLAAHLIAVACLQGQL